MELAITTTLIISDGTLGMEKQSLSLAKLLGQSYEIIYYNPPYLLKKIPLLGKIYFPKISKVDLRSAKHPKYVITTGKRMAGISISLKSELKNKIKTIHIQNPGVSNNFFDLLLIPEHDQVIGRNVIQTKGALTFFNYEELRNDYKYIKKNNTKVILLLIGGNNKRYSPQNIDYYNLSKSVTKTVKSMNGMLLVMPSRRTPTKAIKILDTTFAKNLQKYKMLSFCQNNPYPDILKITDYAIVTSDSVNMISEIASLSIPLFIYSFPKETGKIFNFLDNLEKLGMIKFFKGKLFIYDKKKLETNRNTILKVNDFLGLQ